MDTSDLLLNSKLQRLLLKLPGTGKEYEEVVRLGLVEALGRNLRLARSGSQFGGDVGTGTSGPTVRIEAKRVSTHRSLDQRALLGEISEALDRYPDLDLWVLAASCEVPEQMANALEREGQSRGIGIEILDVSSSRKSKLPLLLANACAEVVGYVGKVCDDSLANELKSVLVEIGARNDLVNEKIVEPECLFDLVAERMRSVLRDCLSKKSASRARFGQVLRDQSFVNRSVASQALDLWWGSGCPPSDLLLLCGEEGDGKTWAAFDWVSKTSESEGLLPLCLVAGHAGPSPKLAAVLAAQLHESFPTTGETVWKTRSQRWLASPSIRSRIILVADGINEQPVSGWRQLVDSILVDSSILSSQVAEQQQVLTSLPVIVTCRAGYWDQMFSQIPHWPVNRLELGPFSEQELQSYLAFHGRSSDEFSSEVHSLLKKPRYSSLVVTHYERLIACGDITIDRLLYEDWKDRYQRNSNLPLDDTSFQQLVQELARQALNGIREVRVQQFLGLVPEGDPARVLSELQSSGVLCRTQNGALRVAPERLSNALGLLLLSELKRTSPAGRDELIQKYFEPGGLDAHAAICSAAVFAATVDSVENDILVQLFSAFFRLQNVPDAEWERIRSYFPILPDVYREVAERLVAEPELNRRAFETVDWAYHRWCDNQDLLRTIAEHSQRWLSFVPLRSPTCDSHESQYREHLRELLGATPTPGTFTANDVTLHVIDSPHLRRLYDLALGLLSAQATGLQASVLRTWALTDSVQGETSRGAEVEWLVRFLDKEASSSLRSEIESMLTVPNGIWQWAAYRLAGMFPDGSASDLQAKADYQPQGGLLETWRLDDPCRAGFYPWRDEDCLHWLRRDDIAPVSKARRLAGFAVDRECDFPADLKGRISRELRPVLAEFAGLGFRLGRSADRGRFESCEPAFARWIPEDLAVAKRAHFELLCRDFDRESIENLSEEKRARGHLGAGDLETIALILRTEDFRRLERFWKLWSDQPADFRIPGGNSLDGTEVDLFRILLLGEGPQVVDLIMERPADAFNARSFIDPLPVGLATDQLRKLWNHLLRDRGELVPKLFFLVFEELSLTTVERQLIVDAGSEYGREGENLTRIFALLKGDRELVRLLSRERRGILFEFVSELHGLQTGSIPTDLPLDQLRSISAPFLSHIVASREDDPRDALELASSLRVFVAGQAGLTRWDPRADPRASQPFSRAGVQRALDADPGLASDLLDRLTEWQGRTSPIENSYWLYVAICECLLDSAPESGSRLLGRLIDSRIGKRGASQAPSSLVALMGRTSHHQQVASLLDSCLDLCFTDSALSRFSLCFPKGQDSWLWAAIVRDLNSERPLLRARAMTLAGFALDTERAVETLEHQKRCGWEESVRQASVSAAKQGEWSRGWFCQFLSSQERSLGWAAFSLFGECVDSRFVHWLQPTLEEHGYSYRDTSPQMRHLRVNHDRLLTRLESTEKSLARQFCHSTVSESIFPWMPQWRLSVRRTRLLANPG